MRNIICLVLPAVLAAAVLAPACATAQALDGRDRHAATALRESRSVAIGPEPGRTVIPDDVIRDQQAHSLGAVLRLVPSARY
jgi:hypothetical protein